MPHERSPAVADQPTSRRRRAFNDAMLARPGDLDVDVPAAMVEGTIPAALRGGQLLFNGPGWTRIGDRVAHPFDGHGYLRAWRFDDDGGVRFRARFIETAVYRAEQQAGRLLKRGLGTNVDDRFWRNLRSEVPALRDRNVANTTIRRVGDRLLAGWEGGLPTAVHTETLATLGEDDFDGALAGFSTLAHMKEAPSPDGTRALVTCSVKQGRDTRLRLQTFPLHAPSSATTTTTTTTTGKTSSIDVTLPGMHFIHDFAVTPHWVIFGANPLRFRPARLVAALIGADTFFNALDVDHARADRLILISRVDGTVHEVSLPGPALIVHFANAFERAGERASDHARELVVDACAFPALTLGEEFGFQGPHQDLDPGIPDARGPQHFLRWTIPLSPHPCGPATARRLVPHGVDFPRIHPDHDGVETPVVFGATRRDPRFSDPFDSLIRVDLEDLERPPTLFSVDDDGVTFIGEPIFVPSTDDDHGGHVLALVSDPTRHRTTLVILDADHIDAGPVATVHGPLLPMAFHGAFDRFD